MKKLNLFSNLWSSLVGSRKDNGSTRLRVVFDSFTCRLRVCPLKLVSVLAILLTIGVGNVLADTYTWTVTTGEQEWFASRTSGKAILNGKAWYFTRSDATSTTYDGTSASMQLGTDGSPDDVVLLSNAFNGTITQIDIVCSSYSGKHTCQIEVGGSTVLEATTITSGATPGTTTTGTISKTGVIKITFTKGSGARYLRIKSITVKYSTGTFNVDWNVGGTVEKSETGVSVGTPPSVADNALGGDCSTLKFLGWSQIDIGATPASAPIDLFTSNEVPPLSGNTTYYAVFGEVTTNTEDSVLIQFLKYDTWTYSGTTSDKTTYRLFAKDAYVQSEAFDLSRLAKVAVGAGYYSSSSCGNFSIKDASGNNWNSGAATTGGEKQYIIRSGSSLTGRKALRVIASSGDGSSNGLRLYKIRIYQFPLAYSNCVTSCGSTWKFKYSGDDWTEHTMDEADGVASYSIELAADSRFEFGIDDNGTFYKNNGTIITTTSGWTFNTSDGNCKIHTGPSGTYTFAINTTTKAVTVTYPTDVTHPNEHYVYFKNTNVWGTVKGYLANTGNDNKAAAWPGSDMQATTTICGETYHYAALNAMSGTYNLIIFNNGSSGSGNQTSNLSTTSSLGKYNANTDADWHDFPFYDITFDKGTGDDGSMSDLEDLCPEPDETLVTCGFTKTGYDFSGWKTDAALTYVAYGDDDDGTHEVDAAVDDIVPDQAKIKELTGDVTLTAQWSASTITITLKKNHSDGTGSNGSATIKYDASALLADPTHASRTGYVIEGYYADAECTHKVLTDAGVLVNYTGYVEEGKWVRAVDTDLYANWTANKHYYVDLMHGHCDGEHTEPITGNSYNCYLREGYQYTVPNITGEDDSGSNTCVTGHKHFIGWSKDVKADGELKATPEIIEGGSTKTATASNMNTVYYAIWAEEE